VIRQDEAEPMVTAIIRHSIPMASKGLVAGRRAQSGHAALGAQGEGALALRSRAQAGEGRGLGG